MLPAARESRREILGSRSRFTLPTVAPGQNSGGDPYRQLCPAYPSADQRRARHRRSRSPRAKGSAGAFQRGKSPNSKTQPETYFSTAHPQLPHNHGSNGIQQAKINSRNQTTIATEWKHRQPMFLHPTLAARKRFGFQPRSASANRQRMKSRLAEFVSILYTTGFPFY